ncbi:hypothetical protein Tco_0417367 [Tanacetum coccineum]
MLKKFGLEDSKPTKTPMLTEIKLTKDDEANSVDRSKCRVLLLHFNRGKGNGEERLITGNKIIRSLETRSKKDDFEVVEDLEVWEEHLECCQARGLMDVVFDGAFGGVGDEEVVVGEGVVVISSSLDMLTNNCLGGIMVSLIFLEGLYEEPLVEFMIE